MTRHEVNGLRRYLFRCNGQVAFVFAVFIIHHDDHLSRFNVFNGFLYGREIHRLISL